MKTVILLLLFSVSVTGAWAQHLIKGKVTDQTNQPLPGANVYVKGSYDGASTGADGSFSFKTDESGEYILVISFLGYQTRELPIQLPHTGKELIISLEEAFSKLDAVTITAGSFEASDEKKGVVLRPLDIATTAGATADIAGALNTLPGTQKVGETGRLFVRGGEGHETRTFVDGLFVQNPYNTAANNLPSRSRFSPFLFKGTTFSTGGYSAEYSQALSSALVLNTIDFPTESKTDISLMTVGGGLAHTHAGDKQAITGELSYTNLYPYFRLVKQNVEWHKAPESLSGSVVYRYKPTKNGLLKVYGTYSGSRIGVTQPDAETLIHPVSTDIRNQFAYINASYRDVVGKKWTIYAGAAYNYNQDRFQLAQNTMEKTERAIHLKNTWTYDMNDWIALRVGGESFINRTRFTYRTDDSGSNQDVQDALIGGFSEADLYLSKKLTARAGLRMDYSKLQQEYALNPRVSMAYKTGGSSQVSLAHGQFCQQPQNDWFQYTSDSKFEKAAHYIFNYQWIKNERTFRAEVYHKQYSDLIQFTGMAPMHVTQLTNKGHGYARGLDVFWRDRKTFKNADYWVSYSLLDTRRQYLNFPQEAVPAFASAHNLSIVYKYFVTQWRTQLGVTASYTSPRPYHDPNQDGFNQRRTPAYRDLSVNAAFLLRENTILYASATNVLGTKNIFGYRYAQQPDADGQFRREPIVQGAPRFLFIGLFITLTKDNTQNQLDNL